MNRSTRVPTSAPIAILHPIIRKAIHQVEEKLPNMMGKASSEQAKKMAMRVPIVKWPFR